MTRYILMDGRACDLSDEGFDAATLLCVIEAASDSGAITKAKEKFPQHSWALFRGTENPVPVACSNETGVYWRADEQGGAA